MKSKAPSVLPIIMFLLGFIVFLTGAAIMLSIVPPERITDLMIGIFAMFVGGVGIGAAIQSNIIPETTANKPHDHPWSLDIQNLEDGDIVSFRVPKNHKENDADRR